MLFFLHRLKIHCESPSGKQNFNLGLTLKFNKILNSKQHQLDLVIYITFPFEIHACFVFM